MVGRCHVVGEMGGGASRGDGGDGVRVRVGSS